MYESTKKAIKKYREKNKSITLLISKTFYERIKKQSEKDNTSVSSLIKTAVADYLDKREQEMAQAKAQQAQEREQRKQERAEAKEQKQREQQEAFRAAHAYDPTPDLPKRGRDVIIPEPLEPIDYRLRMEEHERKEEEEKRKREAEEEEEKHLRKKHLCRRKATAV